VRTYDMGGSDSTLDMGRALAATVSQDWPVAVGR
jgi:hypothetical protein